MAFGVRSFPTNTSFSTTRFHLLIFVFVMTLGLPFTVLQCLVSFIFSIPNLDPVSLPWSSTRECHHWTTGTETQTDLDSQSREALHHWLTSILCVVQSYTDSAKINFSTLVLALVCRTFSFRHTKNGFVLENSTFQFILYFVVSFATLIMRSLHIFSNTTSFFMAQRPAA